LSCSLHVGAGGGRCPHAFVRCFGFSHTPFFSTCELTNGPNHSSIGLFRPVKWAIHSLPRARELLRAGVGILGQGHTPHSGSALACWRVLPRAGPRRASASGRSQTSRVRSRTVRPCVPSQAQAVARRSSHRHRTPAIGTNGRDASAMRTWIPCRWAVRNQAHRADAVERSEKRSPTRIQAIHAGQGAWSSGGPAAAARPPWPAHAAQRWRAPPGRCRGRRCRRPRSHSLGPALSARGPRQARLARRGPAQMPPDGVVQ
jgi:hypothetical protein